MSGIDVKIILHVIADQATVDGSADNPGYLAGHGVISADHVRDIATRPEVVARPMGSDYREAQRDESSAEAAPTSYVDNPRSAEAPSSVRDREGPDQVPDAHTSSDGDLARRMLYLRAPQSIPRVDVGGTPDTVEPPFVQAVPLPAVQPGDPYRPSAVADSYIRIRDCYCTWPGCDRKAWGADLDHTHEYNHTDPSAGGHTHPGHMKVLCRFHHLLKTYSDWLDDQYPDTRNGRTRLVFITPEGRSRPSLDRRRPVPGARASRLGRRPGAPQAPIVSVATIHRQPPDDAYRCQTCTPSTRKGTKPPTKPGDERARSAAL